VIRVQYERGVFLPEKNIWLDPWDPKPFAFVSHAHSDHIAPHGEIIVSERTSRLMRARLAGERTEHVLDFGIPTNVDGLRVTLLPAGHIFGSAQFFLETEADTLLYTGDFKLRPGRSAEAPQWKRADTLIMETTYGLPPYRLPPTDLVVQQIVAFCREALEEGAVPVLLGYSLGKAQEILCSLAEANLRPMLHGSVYRMTRIYEQFGQSFCEYDRYEPDAVEGKVLICPPSANRSRMIQRLTNKRVAMISGWAVEPNAIYRYQVDAAFPLSDHADYADLMRYVELVQPERVLTLHGFAAEFARDLRELSDPDLAAALASGDVGALGELYDRYGSLAFAVAVRVVGDSGRAEDVVQEAFLKVWRSAARFDAQRGSLRGWLLACVRNRAIDSLRGRGAHEQAELELQPELVATGSGSDPWREVSRSLERAAIQEALSSLPPEQRQAIELAYYGGLTQVEISRSLDVPLGTIKTRMRAGLHRLRLLLADTRAAPN